MLRGVLLARLASPRGKVGRGFRGGGIYARTVPALACGTPHATPAAAAAATGRPRRRRAVHRGLTPVFAGACRAAGASRSQIPAARAASQPVRYKSQEAFEEVYQKKTQREHILLRPEPYVGSVQEETSLQWVLTGGVSKPRMQLKATKHVPALVQCFDEILVNAADNASRTGSNRMSSLKVDIDAKEGIISVSNDGPSIPIRMHATEKVYIPELIFGHLLTSSNYDDSVQRYTGGRHGFGAKLTNIFSHEFTVEVCDSKKHYTQTWRNNMQVVEPPVITSVVSPGDGGDVTKSFTKVTFRPDLSRFGGGVAQKLSAQHVHLMSKRAFDVAATVGARGVQTYLNGAPLTIKGFEDYLSLYPALNGKQMLHNSKANARWHVAIGTVKPSYDGPTPAQVSIVNSISTPRGGTHVDHVAMQVCRHVAEHINKTHKDLAVTPGAVRAKLAMVVSCEIPNPSFDSQTKDALITPASKFTTPCKLTQTFLKQVVTESGLVEAVVARAKARQKLELKSKTKARKGKTLHIPKLDDANWAGSADKSHDCTLILTEGDSAKALAMAGLAVVGRDRYGVFPLKGKVLNVRDAAHKQIVNNQEIANVIKILGLVHGKDYSTPEARKTLRYGRLMLMTDQDHDGSHIKGLFINLLHFFWPSLLECNAFLQEFITPIVKASRGSKKGGGGGKAKKKGIETHSFYTLPEFDAWKLQQQQQQQLLQQQPGGPLPAGLPGWQVKYYKGLGTNTAAEGREYFSALDKHQVKFVWGGPTDGQRIELAFSKANANLRKKWLAAHEPGTHVDHSNGALRYSEFIDHELILFSQADNRRSIPSVVDGLKHGQRKILYACFKRKLAKEIKVAQLAGYVSEHTGYHHGEVSLHGTIVNMAQGYVGSNNIPLLTTGGQFGTRHMGGKDAASARYIYTRLRPLTRLLFRAEDDAILDYLDDDGTMVEPQYYLPIIPMVLVNGAEGIGTGFSTSVPRYNPQELITNIRRMLRKEQPRAMVPWTAGHTGEVHSKGKGEGGYVSKGRIKQLNGTTLEITELPVGKWTQDYKAFLTKLMNGDGGGKAYPRILRFSEHHKTNTIKFIVILTKAEMAKAEKMGLHAAFKLDSSVPETNMHMFDAAGQMRRYDGPLAVLKEYVPVRLKGYVTRKAALLARYEAAQRKASNRVRFVRAVMSGELVLNNKRRKDLAAEMQEMGFMGIKEGGDDAAAQDGSSVDSAEESSSSKEGGSVEEATGKQFSYLLNMPLASLTQEKVEALERELAKHEQDLERLRAKSPEDLWIDDLAELEEALGAAENDGDGQEE